MGEDSAAVQRGRAAAAARRLGAGGAGPAAAVKGRKIVKDSSFPSLVCMCVCVYERV